LRFGIQFFARSANQNIVDVSRIAWLEHFPTELAPHRRGSPKKISNPDIGFVFSYNLESLTKSSPAQPFQQENFTNGFFLQRLLHMKVQRRKKPNKIVNN